MSEAAKDSILALCTGIRVRVAELCLVLVSVVQALDSVVGSGAGVPIRTALRACFTDKFAKFGRVERVLSPSVLLRMVKVARLVVVRRRAQCTLEPFEVVKDKVGDSDGIASDVVSLRHSGELLATTTWLGRPVVWVYFSVRIATHSRS